MVEGLYERECLVCCIYGFERGTRALGPRELSFLSFHPLTLFDLRPDPPGPSGPCVPGYSNMTGSPVLELSAVPDWANYFPSARGHQRLEERASH